MWKNIKRFISKNVYQYKYKITKILSLFGLWPLFYKMYCAIFGPNGGTLKVDLAGKSAKFYVHSQAAADDFKSLWGEGYLLESLMKISKPGDCIYDVGAEIGLYSVFLSMAVGENGQVVAFEPEEIRYKRLKGNLLLNNLNNVSIFSTALGDKNREEKLLVGRDNVAPGFINLSEAKSKDETFQMVKIMNGDEFIYQNHLSLPKAIKIDVEGYEYYVIKGLEKTLKSDTCQIVCCEIHPKMLPPDIDSNMVLDLIKFYGFAKIDIHHRENDFQVIAQK